VNQQWGATNSVAVADDIAYLGMGARLITLEITNPAKPNLVGQSQILPGIVQAVLVQDKVAYVGTGTSVLTFDVNKPHALRLLAELPLPGVVTYLAVDGNVLIASLRFPPTESDENGLGMLVTMRILESGQLQLLDSVTLPWAAQAMALADETVYVSHPTDDTFYAISIIEPTNLPNPAPFAGTALTYSLQARGQMLYVGGGLSNVSAWDISNLSQPQKLWEVQARPHADFGLGVVQGFVLHEDAVYLGAVNVHGQTIGALILEVPEQIEEISDESVSSKVTFQKGHLFFAEDGLTIYDPSFPENIVQVSKLTRPSVWDVGTTGDIGIFIEGNQQQTNDGSQLYAVTIPDLNILGQYRDEQQCQRCFASFLELTIKDSTAYVSAVDDGLRIIDLIDPNNPRLLGSLDAANGFADLRAGDNAVENGWVYVAASGDCEGRNLLVFDLHDQSVPRLMTTMDVDGCIEEIAVSERVLYTAVQFADRPGGAIYLFESYEAELHLVGTVSFPAPVTSVQGFEGGVVVGTSTGLHILTAADLSDLTVVADLSIPGGVNKLAIAGELALVTTGNWHDAGQLYAINLSDPAAPRLVGAFRLPAGRGHIAVAGDYVLVGNPVMGLVILRLNYNNP
jgi:hypothetical protein